MQGLEEFIPTEKKATYINQLSKVGFDTIDFGSFVSAKAIPQLRDTADVLQRLDLSATQTRLLAIVANARGAADGHRAGLGLRDGGAARSFPPQAGAGAAPAIDNRCGGFARFGGGQEAAGAKTDAGRGRTGADRTGTDGVIHSPCGHDRMIVFKLVAAR